RLNELVLCGQRGRSGCSPRWGHRRLLLLPDIDRRAAPIQVHSILTWSNQGIAFCSEGPIGERLIEIVVFSGRDAVGASGGRVEIEVECPDLGRPHRESSLESKGLVIACPVGSDVVRVLPLRIIFLPVETGLEIT